MTIMLATSFYLIMAASINTWKILDFFSEMSFTAATASNICIELFFCMSAFIGAYQISQIYDCNEGKLTGLDFFKIYARKVVRFLPFYYFVLSFGWFVVPRLNSGPVWYIYQELFYSCGTYWWAQVLLVGDMVPFFQAQNEGCYYWSWSVTNDIKLFLLVPFYVILYKRSRAWGHAVVVLVILGNCALNMLLTNSKDLTAGLFSSEDYYLFSTMANKFYTKLGPSAFGVMCAVLYLDVLQYRKVDSEDEKKEQFPKIHFFHKYYLAGWAVFFIALANIVWQMFVLYEPGIDPYAWTMTQNIIYYGLARISYTISVMAIFFVLVFGHFNIIKRSLINGVFRTLGKLAFQSALIFPIVIMYFYGSVQYGLFLTFMGVQYIAVGNMVCICLAGFAGFLLFEYPMKAMSVPVLLKLLSHNELLREKLMVPQLFVGSHTSKKIED